MLFAGCTSVKMTGTPRTGTEQLLLTGTWDSAPRTDRLQLARAGRRSSSTLNISRVIDKDWIISSIRRSMAEQGLLLENSKDKAQDIVEVAFGAYGTDERDRKFGLAGFQHVALLDDGRHPVELEIARPR